MEDQTKIALVDDHELLRSGLSKIIERFEGYTVVIEAGNGKDFIDKIKTGIKPDIILLDISMPVMDGFETALWIKDNLPKSRVLVLSVSDNESAVIRMINSGARGYLLKDSKPAVLKQAFDNVRDRGFYSNDLMNSTKIWNAQHSSRISKPIFISDREKEFLQLACSDLTYKEIADRMHSSPRTIDNYRDNLFFKFDIKSRVGLVLFAIKEGHYKI